MPDNFCCYPLGGTPRSSAEKDLLIVILFEAWEREDDEVARLVTERLKALALAQHEGR
jgi:hypothetical protein